MMEKELPQNLIKLIQLFDDEPNIFRDSLPYEHLTRIFLYEKRIQGEPIVTFYDSNYSVVYRLEDKYCLKVFTEKALKSNDAKQECLVLQKLQDAKYVPRLYCCDPEKYILMEWIEGQSAEDITTLDKNSIDELHKIRIDLINRGIDYYDWKPAHVILTGSEPQTIKIIDFNKCDQIEKETVKDLLIKDENDLYAAVLNGDEEYL